MEKVFTSMITYENCPLCGSNVIQKLFETKDWLVTQEHFPIYACRHCGFRFTNPRPTDEKLLEYYQSEDYVSHSEKAKNFINRLFLIARTHTIRWKVNLVKKFSVGNKLLDYGAGSGYFLFRAQQKGFEVFGVEPNAVARTMAQKYHLRLLDPSDPTILKQQYDAITLWHVLEHLPDFKQRMQQFHTLLAEKGTLFLALPNFQSYDALFFKEHWAAYDAPRHLWHFSPKQIEQLAITHGFNMISKRPMMLDVYYISMLSFRNLTGKSRLFHAMVLGSYWNLRSIISRKFSSIVYVLRKR